MTKTQPAKAALKAAPAKAQPKATAKPAARPTKPAEPEAPKVSKSEARQDLARRMLLAISTVFESADGSEAFLQGMSRAEAAKIAANMIHHFPTGRDEQGKRIWVGVLPKPQRSDWA